MLCGLGAITVLSPLFFVPRIRLPVVWAGAAAPQAQKKAGTTLEGRPRKVVYCSHYWESRLMSGWITVVLPSWNVLDVIKIAVHLGQDGTAVFTAVDVWQSQDDLAGL